MAQANPHGNVGGYEKSDAHLKSVAMLVALTVVIALAGVISMWFLFGYIVERDASRDTPPSPLADTRAPFTGPRLQVSPPQDMKAMKAAEQEVLESYDWVDRDRGIVRIPIERAIDLLAKRSLPIKASGEEQ
jgi:hypothetical protein